jgi:prolycopene isomerase
MAMIYSDQSWWDDERYEAAQRGEWPDVSLMFVGTACLLDDSLAENPDEQVVITAAFSSPDPKSPMNPVAVERSEATMREVYPEMFDHVIRREPYHALHVSNMTRDAVVDGQGGEAIGVGQVIGQCGKSKPDVRAPLPGLYFTGCDAGGYGAGTHQAADSGFKVAAIVASDLHG